MYSKLLRISQPSNAFLLSAAILSCVYLYQLASSPEFYAPPKAVGDGLEYENLGFHLWKKGEFRVNNKDPEWLQPYEVQPEEYALHLEAQRRDMLSTGRPPLFPVVIATFYSVFGRTEIAFAAVRVFSGLCLAMGGSLAVLLLAQFLSFLSSRSTERANQDYDSLPAAFALVGCIGILASNRTLLSYAEDFLTEPLSLLLMQMVVFVFCLSANFQVRETLSRKAATRRIVLALIAGLLFGSLVLARSIFVVWIPGMALILAVSQRGSWLGRLASASTFMIATLLICTGWWVRNTHVLERPMPLGTQGPITLLGAYSDEGWANGGEWAYEPEQRLRKQLRTIQEWAISDRQFEVLLSEQASLRVRRWVLGNPDKVMRMAWPKIRTHWNPYHGRSLIWKVLMLLGAVTLLVHIRWVWPQATVLLGLPILSTLVVVALYTVGGRFLVPLYGVLSIVSGIGIYGLLRGMSPVFRRFLFQATR